MKGNSLDISKWKCASEPIVTTTTTTVTTSPTGITGNTRFTTATTTTTQPVRYRIPPNLSCKKNDRIINGVEAIENSWPWIVRMSFGAFMCGGTILSENLIVTAAHCCASASNRPDRIRAFIGDHNRNVFTTSCRYGATVLRVSKIHLSLAQTQTILFLKSISEKGESEIE